MTARSGARRRQVSSALLAAALAAPVPLSTLLPTPSRAQAAAPASARPPIYSCIDAHGRRVTSDRPIPECLDREQKLHNRDGSVRGVQRPSMTAAERVAAEEAERRRQVEAAARQDAVRRDRNLLSRYPDEATHQRAREAALDDVRKSIATSQRRIAELQKERVGLQQEAEFYVGRAMPFKLRQQIEDNTVSTDAQKTLVSNAQAELVRINALYDAELARLRRLWAGEPPGSTDEPARAASEAASAARRP